MSGARETSTVVEPDAPEPAGEAAFRRVLRERGIHVPERFVSHEEMSEDLGFLRAASWLPRAPLPVQVWMLVRSYL